MTLPGHCFLGFLCSLPFVSTKGLPLVEDVDAAVYHFLCPVALLLSIACTAIYGSHLLTLVPYLEMG